MLKNITVKEFLGVVKEAPKDWEICFEFDNGRTILLRFSTKMNLREFARVLFDAYVEIDNLL